MPRLVRLACLAVVAAAVAAFLANRAEAAPAGLNETLTTEHFVVHFTGDNTLGHATIRQYAGEFAANAEWAWSTYTASWGFPVHVADADGRIDVYVFDLSVEYANDWRKDAAGLAVPSGGGNQVSGTIEIDKDSVRSAKVAAHEVFHILQFAQYAPAPSWFKESTADWAAHRLLEYREPAGIHEPDNSIDCAAAGGGNPCGLTGYESGGYSRWTWWQYLGERYGQGIVKETWDAMVAQSNSTYDGDDAIRDVLAGKGAALADVFNDYTVAVLTGAFTAASLKSSLPRLYKSVQTPDTTKALTKLEVAVNRLATRFVELKPPVGDEGPCYAATLTLNVTIPAGTSSKPQLYMPSTTVRTPLGISGSTASITTAWDTCSSQAPAFLSLPNASQTLDGRMFVVTGSVTVDTKKIVNARTPPAGAVVTGTVIAAPTEEPAPTIALYASNVLRVLGSARTIGFVVHSSGAGTLRATFAGERVRDVALRAGVNRIVLRLPKRAAALAYAAKPVLALTSISPSGDPGATIEKRVTVAKPAPKRAAKNKRP